ncbi:hypothetical protein BGW37DRAFT_478033 [Umbelopsis sp. PMI_123]|nr:hypothetical protein BGW37DRAFT_478033 [Umbelopsis sp. PMI_123]
MLSSILMVSNSIICGDFNVRMGNRIGDTVTNVTERTLCNWITDQLYIWNAGLAHGVLNFTTFRGGETHQNIVDLITSNFSPTNASMSIRTKLSIGSNHHLLSASFDLPASDTIDAAQPKRRMWNLSRLQEIEPFELYESLFDGLLGAPARALT